MTAQFQVLSRMVLFTCPDLLRGDQPFDEPLGDQPLLNLPLDMAQKMHPPWAVLEPIESSYIATLSLDQWWPSAMGFDSKPLRIDVAWLHFTFFPMAPLLRLALHGALPKVLLLPPHWPNVVVQNAENVEICSNVSQNAENDRWLIMIERVQNDWPLETPPFINVSQQQRHVSKNTQKPNPVPKKPNPVHHILAACPESSTAKAAKVLLQSGWWRRLQKDLFCNSMQRVFSKGSQVFHIAGHGSISCSDWICSTLSCTNLSIKSGSNWPSASPHTSRSAPPF